MLQFLFASRGHLNRDETLSLTRITLVTSWYAIRRNNVTNLDAL